MRRSGAAPTHISYRHVWQPGDEVVEFASGMTKNLGVDGWELVTAGVESARYQTIVGPQSDAWANFPIYRLFFKRPTATT